MNIKFEMDNFYTRYLKRFLNKELSYNNVLGKFSKEDQRLLIQYLNLPNVKDTFEVYSALKEEFTDLNILFTANVKDTYIDFLGGKISTEIVEYIDANKDNIDTFCKTMGWSVADINEYMDVTKDINEDGIVDNNDIVLLQNMIEHPSEYTYEERMRGDLNYDGEVNSLDMDILSDYLNTTKLYITIEKASRKNYFPNKDMLVFVNQFDGTFIYNYALRYGEDYTDIPTKNPNLDTKLGVYKCKPNQKISIAHNSNQPCYMVIGSTPVNRLADIENFICDNVVEVTLRPGEHYEYTTASSETGTGMDAEYVLIQVPSNYEQLTNGGEVTVVLDVGDINFDGKIDETDYQILAQYTATGPGSEDLPYNKANWTPTPKQLAVMNIDEASPEINVQDAVKLWHFIKGDSPVSTLGFVYYTYNDPTVEPNGNNVSELLIIDGHYPNSINIPYKEFTTNSWVVHEKFFNYLLDMAIHPYSDQGNITYLQKLLKEIYPNFAFNKSYFYNGIYSDDLKKLVLQFQQSFTNYTRGDMNVDGKLDNTDLDLLEPFLRDYDDIYLVEEYLNGQRELSPEEIARLDQDGNGIIDGRDLAILKQKLEEKYTPLFIERADVNDDDLYNQADYNLLKANIDGIDDSLKNFDISFILGYCDVQTEALLEQEANPKGDISEVSK